MVVVNAQDGGSKGEEEGEVPMGDKEVDVIGGMERKQMIEDVLVLPLLSPK